jgi:hypothetical protein
MFRYTRGSLAWIGCLAVLLVLPAKAAATIFPWETPRLSGFAMDLGLGGSNGYSLGIEGWGHNVLLVATSHPNRPPEAMPSHVSKVEYLTQGTVRRGRIRAVFPGLGRIDARFKAHRASQAARSGSSSARPGVCETVESTERSGTFVGTIDFTGEGDLFSVHRHRVKGTVGRPLGVKGCDLEEEDNAPQCKGCLSQQRDSPGSSVSLESGPISLDPASQQFLFLFAGMREEREEMTVVRSVLAISPANDVVIDSPHGAFTLLPPPPFSGAGAFQVSATGATTSTGSLAVRFPGIEERVGLVGSTFSGSFGL